ncbi:hypothetical protein ABH935_006365 [Catenulispora sp. GAS73]|uniref:FHA domain-containing protein n=1 Tax=Catenulispora sp. GAS73 TaxID=3156269 RepID=UPI00351373A8
MAFLPHALPPSTPLSGGVPEPAPPGTIFVIADRGGWAVPPRTYALTCGRNEDEVHVPFGLDDDRISRVHVAFECDGGPWWLVNRGQRPIQIPDGPLVLQGHVHKMGTGYTPLIIVTELGRSHLIHVRVVGYGGLTAAPQPGKTTAPPVAGHLTKTEHLLLTALAHRYLRGERHPQPATRKQTAEILNRIPGQNGWDEKQVDNRVSAIRKRLAIPFTSREEMNEPVGNTLNHNLIHALLRSAMLLPDDLRLLHEDDD